jgi:hypothetical protein
MNCKPFRKTISKGLVAGTDNNRGYWADATGYRKVARLPGNDLPFVCRVSFLITN